MLPKQDRRPKSPRTVLFLLARACDSVEFLAIREIMSHQWGLGNTPYIVHFLESGHRVTFRERRHLLNKPS